MKVQLGLILLLALFGLRELLPEVYHPQLALVAKLLTFVLLAFLVLLIRTSRRTGRSWKGILLLLISNKVGSKFSKYVGKELEILGACLRVLKKEELKPLKQGQGSQFAPYFGLRLGEIATIGVCLLLIDGFILHLAITLFVEAESLSFYLHLGLIILEVYSILWIVGGYRLILESHHVLSSKSLVINLAFVAQGQVRLKDIVEVKALKMARKEAKSLDSAILISLLQDPNIQLEFKSQQSFSVSWGQTKQADRAFLTVSDPEAFVQRYNLVVGRGHSI